MRDNHAKSRFFLTVKEIFGFSLKSFETMLSIAAIKDGNDLFLVRESKFTREGDSIVCDICNVSFFDTDFVESLLSLLVDNEVTKELQSLLISKNLHPERAKYLRLFDLNLLLSNNDSDFVQFLLKYELEVPKQLLRVQKSEHILNFEDYLCDTDVFYVRAINAAKSSRRFKDDLAYFESKSMAIMPVKSGSFNFNDKLICFEDSTLSRYSGLNALIVRHNTASESDESFVGLETYDNVVEIAEFYKIHGKNEGLVLKPYKCVGGDNIFIINPKIENEEELHATVRQALQGIDALPNKEYISKIIVQRKLFNLQYASGITDPGYKRGDLRITIIAGEYAGSCLRCSLGNVHNITQGNGSLNLLDDDMPFSTDNIRSYCEKYRLSEEYKCLLLEIYDHVIPSLKKWCSENNHFHIGFDLLIGQDSRGNWQYCLTEANNITPDAVFSCDKINAASGNTMRIAEYAYGKIAEFASRQTSWQISVGKVVSDNSSLSYPVHCCSK